MRKQTPFICNAGVPIYKFDAVMLQVMIQNERNPLIAGRAETPGCRELHATTKSYL